MRLKVQIVLPGGGKTGGQDGAWAGRYVGGGRKVGGGTWLV